MRLIFINIVLRSHTFSDDKLNSGGRGEVRDTRIGGGVLTRIIALEYKMSNDRLFYLVFGAKLSKGTNIVTLL